MIKELIQDYIVDLQKTLMCLPLGQIEQIIETLLQAQQERQTIFVFGNGGSAATASHMACDLGKNTIRDDTPRMRVVALTDNVELITAWANDTDYQNIFAEQLRGLIEPGDVAIGISGSGRSRNVLNAIRLAHQVGATTIGLTGFEGGLLADMVDIPLVVPSNTMEQIEDVHLVLDHIIATTIREIQRRQADLISELHQDLKVEIGANGETSQTNSIPSTLSAR